MRPGVMLTHSQLPPISDTESKLIPRDLITPIIKSVISRESPYLSIQHKHRVGGWVLKKSVEDGPNNNQRATKGCLGESPTLDRMLMLSQQEL